MATKQGGASASTDARGATSAGSGMPAGVHSQMSAKDQRQQNQASASVTAGLQTLCIEWSTEENAKNFEIHLHDENRFRYNIRISCGPEDFYKLKFIFDHKNTKGELENILSQENYELKVVEEKVFVGLRQGSQSSVKPDTIRDYIEKALRKVGNDLNAWYAETSSYNKNLVQKCKEINQECQSSDIIVYPDEGRIIWLVGINEVEMKKVIQSLENRDFSFTEEQSLAKGTDTGKGCGTTETHPGPVTGNPVPRTSHLQKTSQVSSKVIPSDMSLMKKEKSTGLVNDPTKFQNVFRNVQDGSSSMGSSDGRKAEQEEQKTDGMTSDSSEKIFKILNLPMHFALFLGKYETGRRYIEKALKKDRLRINLICVSDPESKLKVLKVLVKKEMNLEEIERRICEKLFYIPPEDYLCEIFKSEIGRQCFETIANMNSGKVDMILLSENQPCCVGTSDIEEEIKKSLRLSLVSFTETEQIPVSSDVWHFCKQHMKYESEEKGVNINFIQDVESSTPWFIEISGPFQDVRLLKSKLMSDIDKVKTEIMGIDPLAINSQQLQDPLFWEKLDEGKKCVIGFKAAEVGERKPWKKWIKKDRNIPKFTYEVNYNYHSSTSDDVHIILCLEEPEKGGARRKTSNDPPFEPLMDESSEIRKYMIHVRPASSGKSKDHLAECLKALFAHKDIRNKEKFVVSCQLLQEKEIVYCTKTICHEIDHIGNVSAAYTNLKSCQFYDERPEMFPLLIDIFDDYLLDQDSEVLQWKGRAMDVQIRKGQLALQEDCDILVNSTSANLVLDEGIVSKSLVKVAGDEIMRECKSKYGKGIQPGEIAITRGHGLKCRYVFHGAVKKFSKGEKFESLKKVLWKCLRSADEYNMHSIAFPAIGTGQHGYYRQDVADVMFHIVEEYKQRTVDGSLHRVLFVIFDEDIDSLKVFQDREKKWLKDYSVEKSELSITSDDPDTLQKVCKRIQDVLNPVPVSEPMENKISENERLGLSRKERNQSDTLTKVKATELESKSSYSQQQNTDSTIVKPAEKEKRCLLVQSNLESSAKTKLSREEIETSFSEYNLENVVCPFHGENQALLQFLSKEDCDKCMADTFLKRRYVLCRFPEQAVVDLKAVLHSKMTEFLKKRNISAKDIQQHSGVEVDHSDGCSVTLKGNIMEIKAAYEYLSSVLATCGKEFEQNKSWHMNKKQSQDLMEGSNMKVEESSFNTTFKKTEKEESRGADEFSKASQISGVGSSISDLPDVYDLNPPAGRDRQIEHQSSCGSNATSMISSLNSIVCATGTGQSFPSKRYRTITYDDYYMLKHFHPFILQGVEEKWKKSKTTVDLTFPEEGIVEEVDEMLKDIQKLPKDRISYLEKNDAVEKYMMSKCKDDILCYEAKYCDQSCIAIVGKEKSEVLQAKTELEKLLNPHQIGRTGDPSDMSKLGESLPHGECKPIFTTREGIKVYVYKGSLVNANAEAIVCPVSKFFDTERGLPRIIADKAGEGFKLGCRNLLKEKGPVLPVGFACRINPGDLTNFKAIINVVSSYWATNKKEECKNDLSTMLMHIFYLAEVEKLKSVALPAICSGRAGFPKEVCAKLYATCVVDYSYKARDSSTSIKEIHFVDMSDEMLTVIESVFANPIMIKDFMLHKKEDSSLKIQKPEVLIFKEKPGKYCINQNITIYLYDCEATDKKADALVCTIDESLEESPIGKVLEKAGKKFKETFKKHKDTRPKIGSVKVSDPPGKMVDNYKHIMCICTPAWTSNLKGHFLIDEYFKDMAYTYSNILEEAKKHDIGSIVMPVYGPIKEGEWLVKRSISCLLDEIVKFSLKKWEDEKLFSILIATKKKHVHSLVMQGLQDLIDKGPAGFQYRTKPIQTYQCYGDQPKGFLNISEEMQGLAEYENFRTIVLDISIPDGKQTKPTHPKQGHKFKGYYGKIYLPKTDKGEKVAEMLRKAFDIGILFTVRSRRGEDIVTYTDIPLKTSRFGSYGYPDIQYLDRVMRILKEKLGEM